MKFDKQWSDWIEHNLNNNCCKMEMFKILLDNHFDYDLIKNKLNISYIFLENSFRLNTDKVELYILENFLNHKECDEIIRISNKYFKQSGLTIHKEKFRTSSTAHLLDMKNNKEDYDFIQFINDKICKCVNINDTYSESIQITKYEVGQEFKHHHDFFTPNTEEYDNHTLIQGNRTLTFMIYLNDTEEGGETSFSKLKKSFKPKKGKAIIWNNLNDDKTCNYNTEHAGMPIIKGTKYIITKWFREK
tara:strand:- start:126 stop:863 length:738 start_codon:yes stop_codon:yes gene_type:complete